MHKRFEDFITAMTRLVSDGPRDEPRILEEGTRLLGDLVRHDDWLEDRHAVPHPQFYQQYKLYCAPDDSFSVVSFVWGPGQKTPVHDHTVWGIIGMLRGSECAQAFARDAQGHLVVNGPEVTLNPGDLDKVSPTLGDIHLVRNAFADRVSISIHLYGGNIGRIARHVYVPESSEVKDFVSGYSNQLSPNLWARSAA